MRNLLYKRLLFALSDKTPKEPKVYQAFLFDVRFNKIMCSIPTVQTPIQTRVVFFADTAFVCLKKTFEMIRTFYIKSIEIKLMPSSHCQFSTKNFSSSFGVNS